MTMVGLSDGRTVGPVGGLQYRPTVRPSDRPTIIDVRRYSFWYGDTQALFDLLLTEPRQAVTALIGPSGCVKSTRRRSSNRPSEPTQRTRHTRLILLERN